MNREIKFRGIGEDKKWYYGFYCVNGWEEHTIFIENKGDNNFAKKVIPETVGQYTGLKDRNGVEIYEGDIVEVKNQYGIVIDRREITFGFLSDDVEGFIIPIGTGFNINIENCDKGEIKVIGNIYENPIK